jgi:hypothetical protein
MFTKNSKTCPRILKDINIGTKVKGPNESALQATSDKVGTATRELYCRVHR